MNSDIFSRKLHSRNAAIVMVAIASLYVLFFGDGVNLAPDLNLFGVMPAILNYWQPSATTGLVINIVVMGAIMLMMGLINKAFNVLRAMTWLEIGLFAIMQAAVPYEVLTFNPGVVVALTVLVGLFLMFRSYGEPSDVYGVFLTYLCLAFGVMMQYSLLIFIPLFWLISAQMRIFSLRSFLASLMGIATVWIILLGFGILSVDEIKMPTITSIFSIVEQPRMYYLMVVSGVTALLLVVSISLNLLKTIAYNAKARAFNGALLVVAITTIVAMVIDYKNLLSYLPLLNVCAAYQITHYFVNHRYERQFIAVFAVIGVYLALYIWRI